VRVLKATVTGMRTQPLSNNASTSPVCQTETEELPARFTEQPWSVVVGNRKGKGKGKSKGKGGIQSKGKGGTRVRTREEYRIMVR